MGRTSPAVRAGLRARARNGGASVTAVTAMAAVLLVGCGTHAAGRPSLARPSTSATGPSAGRAPVAGSRAEAHALASRLLSSLILPPGARRLRMRVLPALLRQPETAYGGTHAAKVHRLFLVSEPITAVQGFLMAHAPAGTLRSGYGQGMDQGSSKALGKTVQPGQITMISVSYQPRSLPAGMDFAELDTAAVPAPGGGSLVRADAEAIWYPARSAAENVDPARYRAAVVSITLFNPGQHTVTRTITSARVITRLARLVDGLHAAPYQQASCPAILANYRIAFVPAAPPAPRVVVSPSGCLTVYVTVAGVAQPPLWGDTGLIGAEKRLLHIKSEL
jgi:hypothetical protein